MRWCAVYGCIHVQRCRYWAAAATQCDGQELQWMFADMGIVHSMQAAAVVADKSKGGKKGEEGGGHIRMLPVAA